MSLKIEGTVKMEFFLAIGIWENALAESSSWNMSYALAPWLGSVSNVLLQFFVATSRLCRIQTRILICTSRGNLTGILNVKATSEFILARQVPQWKTFSVILLWYGLLHIFRIGEYTALIW